MLTSLNRSKKSAHCLRCAGHAPVGLSKRGKDTESDADIQPEEILTFFSNEFPAVFLSEIPQCVFLIILLIPQKSSMLIAAILFCHRSFDSTTRRIPPSNEISAVSATISLLTPSEQNPRRQASVRGYLNPFSVRCSTHSV